MQKHTLTIAAIILCTASLFAQQGQMRGRQGFAQVEAEKIAFFTSYLELTTSEAREFWPVYNEFQDQRTQLLEERQTLSRTFTMNRANLAEKEAENISDKYITLHIREIRLTEEFHKKFKTVLPPHKVMLYYQAENEFRMHLLRRIRGGRGGPGGGPGMIE